MRRAAWTLGCVIAAAFLAAPATAAADTSTCQYFTFPIRFVALNITDTGPFDQQGIAVNGSKIQRFNDGALADCGAATITNTDFIIIQDVSSDATASVDPIIELVTGPFAPGFTNEAGSSDEIEFVVDLGGGSDALGIRATGLPLSVLMGRSDNDRLVNLNAFEIDGIDSDMTLEGVETLGVHGGGSLPSDIRATGGAGTGGKPLDLRTTLSGHSGRDRLVGGPRPDDLFGSSGRDLLVGGGGGDELFGGAGADNLAGKAGKDVLRGGKANDRLNGGKGRDRCIGGAGNDELLSCEK